MLDLTTADAILLVYATIQTACMIPLSIGVIRNMLSSVQFRRTLYGNGEDGLCKKVESTRKSVGGIEKNCVIHQGSTSDSDPDTATIHKILKDISAYAASQERKRQAAPDPQ